MYYCSVSFKKLCIQCCLEGTDCCAGSDIVWKCIPGLCCGYGERSSSPQVFIFVLKLLIAAYLFIMLHLLHTFVIILNIKSKIDFLCTYLIKN